MKVAIVSPEVAPFSKTGGLADVAGSLGRFLGALGAEAMTVSPLYRSAAAMVVERLPLRLRVPLGARTADCAVARSGPHYFIECDEFFGRDGLYGTPDGDYPDNPARFILFSRAALELLIELGAPDVIHSHDWQGGLIPAYLKTVYSTRFPGTAAVFTVHNLAYQGNFPPDVMALTGMDVRHFNWRELEFYGRVSFLKAGLVFADLVTTVSPSYAREIITEELGCGLHGVLRERGRAFSGILNGVDYSEWNPETDPLIAANYSADSLEGLARCKAALQERCGLPVRPRIPLAGVMGRLAEQKGIGLLLQAAEGLVGQGLQVVILGSGERRLQEAVLGLASRYPGRFSASVSFDGRFAHQIEAGCDLLLVPSLYEPCGLSHIQGLRYGTVPVVRATGGLADTVEDGITGFAFREYAAEAFLSAVRRALAAYGEPAGWRRIVRAGMALDFGWEASARRYLEAYEGAVRRVRGADSS